MTCEHESVHWHPRRQCGRPASYRVRCNIGRKEWATLCQRHAYVWRRRLPYVTIEELVSA